MSAINLTEVKDESQDNNGITLPRNLGLPRDRYNFRIKKCEMKISNEKQNKYLALDVEIYAPDTIVHNKDGKTYNVAGLSSNKIVMIQSPRDLQACGAFMQKLGLKPELDTENPDTEQFIGKYYSDIASGKMYEKRKDPTYEQLQTNPNAKGDVMVNPDTGKPEVSYSVDCGFGVGNVTKATVAAPAF